MISSEKWAGFTDADIEKIKAKPLVQSNKSTINEPNSGLFSKGPLRLKPLNGETAEEKLISDAFKDETSDSDSETKQKPQRLRKIFKSKEFLRTEFIENNPNSAWGNNMNELSDDSCLSSDTSKKDENTDDHFECKTNIHDLEEFEIRQKRIEAENARRRALINQAIMDKRMRTEAEALKLAHISQELNRLDTILSADVSILRDYIEKASLEFSEAEKRYLKSEKEFIEAKLVLYEKMQRKEQLTEHLCTIIEQNENRKADKLVELMKQLEMEAVLEDYKVEHSEPILSKFCVLNDEAYHCCQTLRPIATASPVFSASPVLQESDTPSCNGTQNSADANDGDKTEELE